MSFQDMKNFVDRHSPLILTSLGVLGFVGTAVLAAKATPKAVNKWDEIKNDLPEKPVEKALSVVKHIGPYYAPAIVTGVTSAGLIFTGHSIAERRYLALASLYTFAERRLERWQTETREVVGDKKFNEIESKTHKVDREVPPWDIPVGEDQTLLYDEYSDRFVAVDNLEEIRRSVNDLNERLRVDMFIPINDFYFELGLLGISYGDKIGWAIEDGNIDVTYTSTTTPDGRPCVVLSYQVEPRHILDRFGR